MNDSWEPIITDRVSIERINWILSNISTRLDNALILSTGLMDGTAGVSLYWSYMYIHSCQRKYLNNAHRALGSSINSASSNIMTERPNLSFFNGIVGTIWTTSELKQLGLVDIDLNLLIGDDVNSLLLQVAKAQLRYGHYDPWVGGLSVLPLWTSNSEFQARYSAAQVLADLRSSAILEEVGLTWHYQNPEEKVCYNLGLAHGIPSIIVYVSKLLNRIDQPSQEQIDILKSVVSWLLSKRQKSGSSSQFPALLPPKDQNSRLAWCYGDLSIATSLLQAGIVLKDQILIDTAIEIAEISCERMDPASNGLVDGGICHGTSGVALMYNRLYQKTGNPKLRMASIYWYRETMSKFDRTGKCEAYRFDSISKEAGWIEDYSLLEGYTGIGLSLLAAISNHEPKWDKAFLLS